MKVLIMVSLLFLCSIAISAQNPNFEDYKLAAVGSSENGYYVDNTSIERISNGNIVFWTATLNKEYGVLLFFSTEVSCKTNRLRFRAAFVTDGQKFYRKNHVTRWLTREDGVVKQLVEYVCN